MKLINLLGRTFGHLVVLKRAEKQFPDDRRTLWLCRCFCGREKLYSSSHILHRNTTHCGCLFPTTILGPDAKNTPEYRVWKHIRQRCLNPKNKSYDRYGARGISLDTRWRVFKNFYDDMGPRPGWATSIDRVNNDLGYSKDNCRWATAEMQNNNSSQCRYITFGGETMTMEMWAKRVGVNASTMHVRLKRWPVERALTTKNLPKRGSGPC